MLACNIVEALQTESLRYSRRERLRYGRGMVRRYSALKTAGRLVRELAVERSTRLDLQRCTGVNSLDQRQSVVLEFGISDAGTLFVGRIRFALGMPTSIRVFVVCLSVLGANLFLCRLNALGQNAAPAATPAPPPSQPAKLSASELEKLAMPIALHPDPLISIILPASAYPLEIVQAARFVRDTNNIAKVDEQPWDENVKVVAKFPELIAKMDSDLEWTMKLGQAFIDQPKELMDTIQALRAKAQAAGTLRSTEQQIVTVTNVVVLETNYTEVVNVTKQVVEVVPANPQVVYVPTYPPTVYYPPPAYVYNPYAPLVTFGVGMAVGAIIANNCDWHGGCVWSGHGDVNVDVDRNVNRNVNRNSNVNRTDRTGTQAGNRSGQQKWQPNQSRLSASGAPSASSREARGYSAGSTGAGGRTASPTGSTGQRAYSGTGAGRQSAAPTTSTRSASPSQGSRQGVSSGSSRQASPSSVNRSASGGSNRSAFSGTSSGASARSASTRGASSRSGGFGGSGRSGGGGGRRR